ncbi:hypothetical protein, partial [Halorubrum sp. Atlit-28R]|uniref:hypothetical protein n=1 Tax=Halorubrum sp. Atlit-28R TaxID=2282129 RepID=UPI001F386FB6
MVLNDGRMVVSHAEAYFVDIFVAAVLGIFKDDSCGRHREETGAVRVRAVGCKYVKTTSESVVS